MLNYLYNLGFSNLVNQNKFTNVIKLEQELTHHIKYGIVHFMFSLSRLF